MPTTFTDIFWMFVGLGFFFLVCLAFDRYGSHRQTKPVQDKTPPKPIKKETTDINKERSKLIDKLPLGPDVDESYMYKKPVVREDPSGIKEVYPDRLASLRKWVGFRSRVFEDLWRRTNGKTTKGS